MALPQVDLFASLVICRMKADQELGMIASDDRNRFCDLIVSPSSLSGEGGFL